MKHHSSLVVLFIVAFTTILILKYYLFGVDEFWEYGSETGDIIYDLSIAYVAAFIFYTIDIWIPSISKRRKVNDRLVVPLNRLLNTMKTSLSTVYEIYGDDKLKFECITKELNKSIVSRMDLINDDAPFIVWPENRAGKFDEYLIDHINSANKYINKVINLPVDLEIDLIRILDEIEMSFYHESMTIMYNLNRLSRRDNVQMRGDSIADSFYEYYLLYYELKDYMRKNNI